MKTAHQKAIELLFQETQVYGLRGFMAFFAIFHGTPLHSEGLKFARALFKNEKILWEMHREGGKTTVAKFFQLFFIGHHPETSSIIMRIKDEKANEIASELARIIEFDGKWALIFPSVRPDAKAGWSQNGYNVKRVDMEYDEWTNLKATLPTDPTFVGRGYDSSAVIGSRVTGVLWVDDIHNDKNTRSDRQLRSVKNTMTGDVLNCLQKGAVEVWCYTPWNRNDMYSDRKATGLYTHILSPLLVPDEDGDEWPLDPMIPLSGKKYEVYHPEKWMWDDISARYKSNGAIEFARMYLLDLKAAAGQHLKADWLTRFSFEKIMPDWPVVMGVDYASVADELKDSKRDYFCLAVGAISPSGRVILIDGFKGHVSQGDAEQKVKTFYANYPTTVLIGVEAVGKGEEFFHLLMRTSMLPVIETSPGRKSKGERFEKKMAPLFQFRRAMLADIENAFIKSFIDEWLMWPFGEHDDTLDAVYWMLFIALPYMQAGEYDQETDEHPMAARVKKPTSLAGAFGRK